MIDLTGTWVTSFTSYVHDDPVDPSPAPQLAAYFGDGAGQYSQTAGYFLASTLLWLKFNEDLTVTGSVRINRGGRKLVEKPDLATGANPVMGSYSAELNSPLNIWEGKLLTIYRTPPNPDIQTEYRFVGKSQHELEWVWWKSSFLDPTGTSKPFRANVAQGTLTRVIHPRSSETEDEGHRGPNGRSRE